MILLQYHSNQYKSVIYCFHCVSTGKKYIGKTINEKRRLLQHEYNWKYSYKGKSKFYSAIKKYGIENFIYGIIEECEKNELNKKEKYYINLYNTFENGLNMTYGGESGGNKHSEETKKKMSKSRKGKKQTDNWIYKRNESRKINGKKWSDESREKLRLSKLGKPSPKKGKTYSKKN